MKTSCIPSFTVIPLSVLMTAGANKIWKPLWCDPKVLVLTGSCEHVIFHLKAGWFSIWKLGDLKPSLKGADDWESLMSRSTLWSADDTVSLWATTAVVQERATCKNCPECKTWCLLPFRRGIFSLGSGYTEDRRNKTDFSLSTYQNQRLSLSLQLSIESTSLCHHFTVSSSAFHWWDWQFYYREACFSGYCLISLVSRKVYHQIQV